MHGRQLKPNQKINLIQPVMYIRKTAVLALLGIALTLNNSGWAIPSGHFSWAFGTESPLWDLSGTYQLSPTVAGDVSVDFAVTVTQDATGKVVGSGTTPVLIDGESVSGNYTVSGKVTTSGTLVLLTATVKLSGSGMLHGEQRPYSLTASYKLAVDPSTRQVTGSGKGSAKAKGLGGGPVIELVDAQLPQGMTGAWQLGADLTATGKKLAGTGVVTLSNNRALNVTAKGSYAPANGKSSISLAGSGTSKGSSLTVAGTGDNLQLISAKGKVLGQTVKK
jgi:hypothetical protein